MNYNNEERKIKIVTWVLVALLTLSVIGASLLFILSSRTPSNKLNTVDVGSRITGGGFKSNLTNADVWDGTTATNWTGSGTKTDPYLISSAKQLAGMNVNNSSYKYYGKYFKLTTDIDLNNRSLSIGSSYGFSGYFDGDGHTIANLANSMFSNIASNTTDSAKYDTTIEVGVVNLNITFTKDLSTSETNFGGLARQVIGRWKRVIFDNINVEYSCKITNTAKSYAINFGGLLGSVSKTDQGATISNCTVTGGELYTYRNATTPSGVGGLIGYAAYAEIDTCKVTTTLNVDARYATQVNVGGLCGNTYSYHIYDSLYDGNITFQSGNYMYVGGLVGYSVIGSLSNCLRQGKLTFTNFSTNTAMRVGGLVGDTVSTYSGVSVSTTLTNCISNGYVSTGSQTNLSAGGLSGSANASGTNVYNSARFTTSASTKYTTGATTDANIKLASTYSSWTYFDSHWVINSKINNGYPMLKCFEDVAKVTGFSGSGTSSSPYKIYTKQDLLGFASYYNDNKVPNGSLYWQIVNDIDVSKDSSGVLIHFTPICYGKEFDGYLDGNSKTISGLLIDNQYSYTGLFGTIASGSYVKNLTVKGNIYWDQAYAVGGVAGRVLAGGYLQNCTFTGNIIGVLNTKSSTECSGVVGTYEINGAIDCTATYTDLKYAKISGTSASPTYTYYLYDWARITTKLYNKKA